MEFTVTTNAPQGFVEEQLLDETLSDLSCLNGPSRPVSSVSLPSVLRNDEEHQTRTGTKRRREDDENESTDSSLLLTVAVLTGYAAVVASRSRKKRRASEYFTPIFLNPIAFTMVSDFYGPEMFRKTFRMTRSTFNILLRTVGDLLSRSFVSASEYRRATAPADIRLAITLRVLAGGSYCDLSLAYQVKESTIYDIFTSTCDALMSRLRLKGFPKTKKALEAIARGFQTSRRDSSPIFGCVGALDGICVKIKKPSDVEAPASFFSRKGFYALPVQALCDYDYIFRYCSALCSGTTHDALAHAVSGLKRDIEA